MQEETNGVISSQERGHPVKLNRELKEGLPECPLPITEGIEMN